MRGTEHTGANSSATPGAQEGRKRRRAEANQHLLGMTDTSPKARAVRQGLTPPLTWD